MKQTCKWSAMAGDAKRLAAQGLDSSEIGRRLGISKRTVNRWFRAGRLEHHTHRPSGRTTVTVSVGQSPAEWAGVIRQTYIVDATDEQLLILAESALAMARDPEAQYQARLQAMGRFQSLVKQLSFIERAADVRQAPVRRQTPALTRRVDGDPRAFLETVN